MISSHAETESNQRNLHQQEIRANEERRNQRDPLGFLRLRFRDWIRGQQFLLERDFEEKEPNGETAQKDAWDTDAESADSFGAILQNIDWHRVFPVLGAWSLYRRHPTVILHDIQAGLTAACVLLAQALSYAQLGNVPVRNSLMSTVIPVMVYALLGASRQLSAGPEALTTLLTGMFVLHELQQRPSGGASYSPEQVASLLGFTVGILTFTLGVFDLGFLDNMLNGYLMNGFVLGVAMLISIEQLPALLGITMEKTPTSAQMSSLEKLIDVFKHISDTKIPTLVVSLCCLTILWSLQFLHKRFNNRWRFMQSVPDVLIVVVLNIVLSYALDLKGRFDVQTLGVVDFSDYTPAVPPVLDSALFFRSLQSAAMISILGFIECMIVTRNFALKYDYDVSENRELMALGMANFAGCFFGTYASFGSLPRSKIFANAGATTIFAGFISGLFVLVFTFALLSVLQYMPSACAAAIVFVAALNLIEWSEMTFVIRFRRLTDIFFMFVAWALTFFVSVDYGILLVLMISLLMVMKRASKPEMAVLGVIPYHTENNTDLKMAIGITDILERPDCHLLDGILILSVRSPLQFYNCGQIKHQIASYISFLDRRLHRHYRRTMRNDDFSHNHDKAAESDLHSCCHNCFTLPFMHRDTLLKRRTKRDSLSRKEKKNSEVSLTLVPPGTESKTDLLMHPVTSGSSVSGLSGNSSTENNPEPPASESRFNLFNLFTPHKSKPKTSPMAAKSKTLDVIIFDMFPSGDFDSSALYILRKLLVSYRQHDIRIFFARLHPKQEEALRRVGILDIIGGGRVIFDSVHDAIKAAQEYEEISVDIPERTSSPTI